MNIIIKGASGFMGLFDTGAETFISCGCQESYQRYYYC